MPPQLKRHARAVKRGGRWFIASFWKLAIFLTTRKRGWGISVTFLLGIAIFGVGVFDQAAGLTGHRHGVEAASLHDDPGAPVLLPWERLSIFGSLASVASAPPAMTMLESGTRGVSLVDGGCNDDPPAKQEKSSGPPIHTTIHSSEENAGAGGVYAVCRYHSRDLGWGRAGYTYYIGQDGTTWQLLPHATEPWAQKTENDRDIAIVLQGMAGRNVPSDAQRVSLGVLLAALKQQYPQFGVDALRGHRDWSNADQAQLRAGTWPHAASLANDHQDPAPAAEWENANPPRWGLGAYFAQARYPGIRPRQPRDANGGPVVGSTLAGVSLTYYGAEATGAPRCPRPSGPETAGLPWPTWNSDPPKPSDGIRNEHWAASYVLSDGSPAWPCNSWLRLTVDGHHLDVRVADSGSFAYTDPARPNHALDLSQAASAKLLGRAGSATGVNVEVIAFDDGFSRYAAETGLHVVGAFREPFFNAPGGGYASYGAPLEEANYERWPDEQIVTQRFARATFLYQDGAVTVTRQ